MVFITGLSNDALSWDTFLLFRQPSKAVEFNTKEILDF